MNYKTPQKFEGPKPDVKYCSACSETLPVDAFGKNRYYPDGLHSRCKACVKADIERRKTKPLLATRRRKVRSLKNRPKLENQNSRIQQIVFALAENPKITCEELAQQTGLTSNSIRPMFYTNEYLKSLRRQGSSEVTRMIPEAVHALRGSLGAKSEDVVLKAAVKILESEKVMGPERLEVTVNDYAGKSNKELEDMIMGSVAVPKATIIEAEVIS